MNFYLALGSVEMSTVLNLQSMSMICLLNSVYLVSLSVVCSVHCADHCSLKVLCPSLPDFRISGGGMASWRDAVSLPPSSPFLLWCISTGTLGPVSISVPSSGTPAGNFSKIWVLKLLFQCPKGSWVPGMCTWAQEISANESSNQTSQILCRSCWATLHRPESPVLSWTWDQRKILESTEIPEGLTDEMSYMSEVKGSWKDTHCR